MFISSTSASVVGAVVSYINIVLALTEDQLQVHV